jgi:hypothetical protein
LTRSHHQSPAIHIAGDLTSMKRPWCNLIQNVYRRSLFVRPRFTKSLGFRASRPARTPPSTFLFLHLHLSNSPGPKPLPLLRGGPSPRIRRQVTTDDYRLFCTHQNEELDGRANLPWLQAKAAPRSVGRVIGPPDLGCQRSLSINRATWRRISRREEAQIFQRFAPYLSHNPATF